LKRSNRLVLLIGVFLAIVAFVGIVIIFQGGRANQTGPAAVAQDLPTVFANRDIALGTPVTAEMLTIENRPLTQRDASAFGDTSLLLGKIVRTNVVAGKQLTAEDFDVTGAPLTIDTPPGLLAFALQVDQVSGVGTLIRTGDYVDVLVGFQTWPTVTIDEATGTTVEGPATNPTSTKLVLQGMQVLGTLLPPPPAAAEGEAPAAEGGTALTGQQEIVILGVTPQQAEVVKYAQLDGSISVALRSPADFRNPDTQEPILAPPVETTGITLRTLVDEYQVLVPQVIEAVPPDEDQTP
jgi:pilus assembly protein CpaB